MRRHLLWAVFPLSACSLVYGLHDNTGPIADASPQNGCPADAGAHTFCELFDESPSWPADASMAQIVGAPVLRDAGCNTPPHCLSAAGGASFVERTIATPNGVHHVRYDFQARFDLVDSGVIPRVAWITVTAGDAGDVTFGVTFAHDQTTMDYELFVFGIPTSLNGYDTVLPFALGTWYHLTLDVDLDLDTVSLKCEVPLTSRTHDFVTEWALPKVDPSAVSRVVIGGGVDTGMSHTAATIDTIVVDLTP